MIKREDILSMEYFKKSEFTGCHRGMRYRLEGAQGAEGEKVLRCTVWPEPFNFLTTPDEEKESGEFSFDEDGVTDAVAWMNDRLFVEKDRWENAGKNWSNYQEKVPRP
ncbi:MAG: GNAT family acetyltransferase [Ruminococcus flavefaciens]|nr:GNAT family acetyltransferase [Ruminococcus flavefaciens]